MGRRVSALQYFQTLADREPARSARQLPKGTRGRARRRQVVRELKRASRSAVVVAILLAARFVRAGAKVFLRTIPGSEGGATKRPTFARYMVCESNRKFYDEIIRE